VRPRTQVPLDWLRRHAERGEELEVLILDVLDRAGGNLSVGEKPVEIARARPVEAELDRRVSGARNDACLEVDLQIDHEIEAALRQLRGDFRERHEPARAIEDDYFVH
jgi:hypothetical protein